MHLFFALLFIAIASLASAQNNIQQSFQMAPWGGGVANVFFGDPHRFRDRSRRDRIAVIVTRLNISNNVTSSDLAVFDAHSGMQVASWPVPTGATAANPFPQYSGWVSTGKCAQSRLSGICFFTGTMTGAVAFSETGKMIWNKALFPANATQGTPGHVTWTQPGVLWIAFENGLSSLPMTALDSETGDVVWQDTARISPTLPWAVYNPDNINSSRAVLPHGEGGALFAVYEPATKRTGFEFRAAFRNASGLSTRAVWTNMSLSWSQPGLWDNPNMVVDLPREEGGGEYQPQRFFGYFEPQPYNGSLRQFARLDPMSGAQLWNVNVDGNTVLDFDTYAYSHDFFSLMVRSNNSLQMQRFDGDTGNRKWGVTIAKDENGFNGDTSSILLVGSGLVCSFSLNSGSVQVLAAETGKYLGRIQLPTGVTLCTGTTSVLSPESKRSLVVFGASDGFWRGFEVTL